MATHDIVTIGASAGGIETLKQLMALLPGDLPAAVLIVQHLHPRTASQLDGILARAGQLPVKFASDGDLITHGQVYVSPPDNHMLVEDGHVRVIHGPRENRHRPAVDPLFRSAAWTYGPRVVGVVLSGTMDDGAAGLWAIRSCSGVTVVQDPAEALYSEMPTSALMTLNVDHCEPLAAIAARIAHLAREPNGAHPPASRPATIALENASMISHTDVEDMPKMGKPAGFTCPTCHGSLWELTEGELVRYRCHIGHAFGAESLLIEQNQDVEHALEVALRALEEQGAAARRLGDRLEERVPSLAARYATQATGLDKQAGVIRDLLRNGRMPQD